MTSSRPIVLVRHGETEWSRTHRHTGATDIALTSRGEEQARALGALLERLLEGARPDLVLVSPLQRARRTAELAALDSGGSRLEMVADLREWNYGDVEGITTAEWQEEHPGWSVWDEGPPGGETAEEVGQRSDRVLDRVRAHLAVDGAGPVALVAHGHLLRVLAACWLGLPPRAGALLRLDTASVSTLGYEHDRAVVSGWNATT